MARGSDNITSGLDPAVLAELSQRLYMSQSEIWRECENMGIDEPDMNDVEADLGAIHAIERCCICGIWTDSSALNADYECEQCADDTDEEE